MTDPSERATLRPDWRDRPHPSRFDATDGAAGLALEAHRLAVARGEAGYLDPATGLYVMTAPYLRDRGWCCDRGCRHCPYIGADGAEDDTADRPLKD